MKEKGKICRGAPPYRVLLTIRGGIERGGALGPKGEEPRPGGWRKHCRRRGRKTARNRKRQGKGETELEKDRERGRQRKGETKDTERRQGEAESARGEERRGRRRADKVSVVLVTGWD